MRKKPRMRETVHYEAISGHHPLFAGEGVEVWTPGTAGGPATVEGGDVLVIGRGAVLVGMSERTRPQGVERLAARLFSSDEVTRIVAVRLPEARSAMHLDTVMTMVDGERFIKYARSEEHTSELQSLMRTSYAVFCLKKKKNTTHQ